MDKMYELKIHDGEAANAELGQDVKMDPNPGPTARVNQKSV